jgi:hypothetical protein
VFGLLLVDKVQLENIKQVRFEMEAAATSATYSFGLNEAVHETTSEASTMTVMSRHRTYTKSGESLQELHGRFVIGWFALFFDMFLVCLGSLWGLSTSSMIKRQVCGVYQNSPQKKPQTR